MRKLSVEKFFNKYSREYTSHKLRGAKWYQWSNAQIVRQAAPKSGQKILDLGTGSGALAIALSKPVGRSGQITCVDISGKMLSEAKKSAMKLGLTNLRFIRAELEALNLPSSSLDTVVSSLTLEYVKPKLFLLRRIHKMLKPGGKLVISTLFKPERGYLAAVEKLRKQHPATARRFDNDWDSYTKTRGLSKGFFEQQPPIYPISQTRLKQLMLKAGFVKLGILQSCLPQLAVVYGVKPKKTKKV